MKSRLIADDREGARADARWALQAGAASSESPIGRYAATLAHFVRGEDAAAAELAGTLHGREGIPPAVADSLTALAARDGSGYAAAVRALLVDFEGRDDFLEDLPVADTVLAFQKLAEPRGLAIELTSPLLPAA